VSRTDTTARLAAIAALEQWYLDGGTQPIATYVEEGLAALRPIWSRPT
jgi:hypothetical protein